jgi:membrane protease YdiL (CAAX protease family)
MDELTEQPGLHCPRCQVPLRTGAKFCSACGAPADPAAIDTERRQTARDGARFALHWIGIQRIIFLFGLLLLSTLVLGMIGRDDTTPWSEVVMSVIDAVIVFAFAASRYWQILPLLGPPQADMREAIRLLALALAFIALMAGYFALIEKAGIPIIRVSSSFEAAGWGIGLMILIDAIMPAIVEELAFRGIIQTELEQITGMREALLIQAALFSVLHLLPMMFPSHFIMGLCFGYLRQRTKSLYPGMLLHASWNTLAICQEVYWT